MKVEEMKSMSSTHAKDHIAALDVVLIVTENALGQRC